MRFGRSVQENYYRHTPSKYKQRTAQTLAKLKCLHLSLLFNLLNSKGRTCQKRRVVGKTKSKDENGL